MLSALKCIFSSMDLEKKKKKNNFALVIIAGTALIIGC